MFVFRYQVWIFLSIIFTIVGCGEDEKDPFIPEPDTNPVLQLPDETFSYSDVEFPEHFSLGGLPFFDTATENSITDEGATLGRVLFYDVALSQNNQTSCSSCHLQSKGFSDPDDFSTGFKGGLTNRHSIGLINQRYVRRLFWDLRTSSLKEQVLEPIQDPIEMGFRLDLLVERLAEIEYYPDLFKSAFGDEDITSDRIAEALKQFVLSLQSYQTRFDAGIDQDFQNFNEQELLGKSLFLGGVLKCNQCHFSNNFYNPQALNNGLDLDPVDLGLGGITGNEADYGKFKVPTLRNITETAPYMHDARFKTLREVIEHYSRNVKAHPYLDDRLTENNEIGGPPTRHNLTDEEIDALIAFLGTLRDDYLLTAEEFSNPFQ